MCVNNKVIQNIRETASKKNRKKSNNSNGEKNGVEVKVLFSKEYSPILKEVLQILRNIYSEDNKNVLNEVVVPKYKNEILSNNKYDIK